MSVNNKDNHFARLPLDCVSHVFDYLPLSDLYPLRSYRPVFDSIMSRAESALPRSDELDRTCLENWNFLGLGNPLLHRVSQRTLRRFDHPVRLATQFAGPTQSFISTERNSMICVDHSKAEVAFYEFAIPNGHEIKSKPSPDGTQILTASKEGEISLINIRENRIVQTIKVHAGEIRFAEFSPDGKTAVLALDDNTIKILDLETGQEVRTLRGHKGEIKTVSYSPDGSMIVSAAADGIIMLWDIKTDEPICILNARARPMNFAFFHPNGKMIVAGCMSCAVIWKAGPDGFGGKIDQLILNGVLEMTISQRRMTAPANYKFARFSQDGNTIVFVSDKQVALIRHVDEHGTALDIPQWWASPVTYRDASAPDLDEKWRFTVRSDGQVSVHDESNEELRHAIIVKGLETSDSAQLICEGRQLLFLAQEASGRCSLQLLDLRSTMEDQLISHAVLGEDIPEIVHPEESLFSRLMKKKTPLQKIKGLLSRQMRIEKVCSLILNHMILNLAMLVKTGRSEFCMGEFFPYQVEKIMRMPEEIRGPIARGLHREVLRIQEKQDGESAFRVPTSFQRAMETLRTIVETPAEQKSPSLANKFLSIFKKNHPHS